MKWEFGKYYKLFYFQGRESPSTYLFSPLHPTMFLGDTMNSKQHRSSELGGNEWALQMKLKRKLKRKRKRTGKRNEKKDNNSMIIHCWYLAGWLAGWLAVDPINYQNNALNNRLKTFVSPKKVAGCRGGNRYVEGSCGCPYLKIEKLGSFHFMFFDRYEIQIQDFVNFI